MSDINLSRQVSIERVMRSIATYGPISRASLAKELDLSKQTVSDVMQTLEQRNWVYVIGQTEGHVGRRAITYQINPDCAGVVVVDLGGTKIRACVANLVGEVVVEKKISTDSKGGQAVITQITDLIDSLFKASTITREQVKLAVIGVPGVFDEATDHILMAPNIKGLDKIDFCKTLQEMTGLKIIVENDVNLATKGEHWLSEETGLQDCKSLVLIMIGTGLGAGIIVNGELVKGHAGMAGEIGFLPLLGKKDPQMPVLENALSGVAIEKQYQQNTGIDKTTSEIFTLAEQGDSQAIGIVENAVQMLVHIIICLNLIINPDKFVLGGSIGQSAFLNKLLKEQLTKQEWDLPTVYTVKAGQYAALVGGVAIGLEQTQYDLFASSYGELASVRKFVSFQNANSKQLLRAMGEK